MASFLMFVQILGGLLTPVIACIAIWIGYQQHKTARDKLKLDLFDRRFRVYRGLGDFIDEVNKDGKPSPEVFHQLYRDTDPATFLFGDDVCNYMGEIRKKALELRQAINTIAAAAANQGQTIRNEEFMKATAKERELVGWFYEQAQVVAKVFQPYLGFKKAL